MNTWLSGMPACQNVRTAVMPGIQSRRAYVITHIIYITQTTQATHITSINIEKTPEGTIAGLRQPGNTPRLTADETAEAAQQPNDQMAKITK